MHPQTVVHPERRWRLGKVAGVTCEPRSERLNVLIFTRRVGEEIRIGDHIRVKIIDIKGKQVRLGIDAPPEVIIHREEIYQRINGNNPINTTEERPGETQPINQASKGGGRPD